MRCILRRSLLQVRPGRQTPRATAWERTSGARRVRSHVVQAALPDGRFFPRLIYGQMVAWKEMEGVVGVKEYYGFAPSTFSVNAAMLQAWMKSPQAPLDTLLQEIAAPYGPKTAPLLIQAWSTWRVRGGISLGHDYLIARWAWIAIMMARMLGAGVHSERHLDTPIWKANRRANFMLTQDSKAHPWLFEDAGCGWRIPLHWASRPLPSMTRPFRSGEQDRRHSRQRDVVWKTARAVRGRSCIYWKPWRPRMRAWSA